ncbi:hypothetical protein [Candidatus Borrarchaeum sp.]|uniref:hypothetical protein n=1 Tax=Candidatus Borrarchaeum sp. TaxID=2846742 RepID=UPI002579461F|nr:hypothetical protein [Candidatus Borrarchaeum sp.]
MKSILISYDMRKGMKQNPRRIQFTKGLYGYFYEWETKSGRMRKRKTGILDSLKWYDKVGESTILLENIQEKDFEKLMAYFQSYSDVIYARAFKIAQEVPLYDTKVDL